MLQAVLFDMDGVLIDSEPFHHRITKDLFQELKLTISSEEYNGFIGLSFPEMWKRINASYRLEQTLPEIIDLNRNRIMTYLKNSEQQAIPGVVPLLERLKSEQIELAVASSSPLPYIELVLEKLAIRDFFRVLVSGEEVERGKPAPDIFLRAAELLKVTPEYCLVIEDSKNGVRAAKEAGMKCIGFRNINSGNQELSRADLIVERMDKLNYRVLEELFHS